MDIGYLERFRARSEAERARTEPPAGFPQLPDLPLGRYTDPAFFELERRHLWGRAWLYAAHDSELPEPGSYKVCDLAGSPTIVVRGDDGEVRAFANACRHRGAPVASGPCGTARMLVCQFHSWSYDLQGELIRVPEERDFVGLDRGERALRRFRCERWGGWWFVTRDPDAPPLIEWLGPVAEQLADVARSPVRIVDAKAVELACNWKILAEGFLEVYHARTIHPTTVAPTLDTRGTVISLFANGHQSMLSPVKPGTRGDGREELATLAHLPAVMAEPIQPAFGIFPNLIVPFDGRGFPFLIFTPLAIDRTRLDIVWFAAAWGDGPMPGKQLWAKRFARFDTVMEEDYRNLEPIQRSMEQAAHGGQVINYQERRIWHVHAWIDKMIGPERIPDALRVPDLLAGWIEA